MWKNEEEVQYERVSNTGDKSSNRGMVRDISESYAIEAKVEEEVDDKEKMKNYIEIVKQEINKLEKTEVINVKLKPVYLDYSMKIFQSPQMNVYAKETTTLTCPFCRNLINADIEYSQSAYQKKCCLILALTGLCFCCWIPNLIRSLSDIHYKCPACNKMLKKVPYNAYKDL
jgi:hypothetical protein